MPARDDPAYPVFFSYAHVQRGGFDENPNQPFHEFFEDIGKMLYHLTSFSEDVAFADVSLRAGDDFERVLFERLAQFRVFVPLLSLRYFNSEWCGREWAAFARRCELQSSGYQPIVPILWTGQQGLNIPEWFAQKLLFDDATQSADYQEHGLYGLKQMGTGGADKYNTTLYHLARRISQVSNSAELPDGDPAELRKLPPWYGGPAA